MKHVVEKSSRHNKQNLIIYLLLLNKMNEKNWKM